MRRYACEHCGATLDPGERCDCRDLRVVVLRADGNLEMSLTDGALDTLQDIVGGNIEHVPAFHDIGLLVNEDGIRLGLKQNPFFPGYLGNVIIVGEPEDGGDRFRSLTEYESAGLLEMFVKSG